MISGEPSIELRDQEQKISLLLTKLKALGDRTSKFNDLASKLDVEEGACLKQLQELKNEVKDAFQKNKSVPNSDLRALELEVRNRLNFIKSQFPRSSHFMLQIALGKGANVTLRPFEKRLQYKREYEVFKVRCGLIGFFYSILSVSVLDNKISDAAYSFFMLYYFCTCVLRENILLVNGSRIKMWWLGHHYISIILSGVILIWPSTPIYKAFRTPFFSYFIYVSLLQYLQYRYQKSRLYILVALDRAGPMETLGGDGLYLNTVSKQFHLLLPFLIIGQLWQLVNGIILAKLHHNDGTQIIEWQALVAGVLFVILGIGNIVATLSACKERSYDIATKLDTKTKELLS